MVPRNRKLFVTSLQKNTLIQDLSISFLQKIKLKLGSPPFFLFFFFLPLPSSPFFFSFLFFLPYLSCDTYSIILKEQPSLENLHDHPHLTAFGHALPPINCYSPLPSLTKTSNNFSSHMPRLDKTHFTSTTLGLS